MHFKKQVAILSIFLLLFSLIPIKTYALPTEMGEMEKYIYYLEQEFGCNDNASVKYIKDFLVDASPELVTAGSVAKTVVCSHPYVALAIGSVALASGVYYCNKEAIDTHISSIYSRLSNKGIKFDDGGILTGEQIKAIQNLISEDVANKKIDYEIFPGEHVISFSFDTYWRSKPITACYIPPCSICCNVEMPNGGFIELIGQEYSEKSAIIEPVVFGSSGEKFHKAHCNVPKKGDIVYVKYSTLNSCVSRIEIENEISSKNYNPNSFKNVKSNKIYNFVPDKENVPDLENFVGVEVAPVVVPSTEPGETDGTGGTSVKPETSIENPWETSGELDLKPLKMVGEEFTIKFPFSLPWDLGRSFKSLECSAWSPVIVFPTKHTILDTDIRIDLNNFNPVVSVVRLLELLLFDLCLIWGTTKLIKGD